MMESTSLLASWWATIAQGCSKQLSPKILVILKLMRCNSRVSARCGQSLRVGRMFAFSRLTLRSCRHISWGQRSKAWQAGDYSPSACLESLSAVYATDRQGCKHRRGFEQQRGSNKVLTYEVSWRTRFRQGSGYAYLCRSSSVSCSHIITSRLLRKILST